MLKVDDESPESVNVANVPAHTPAERVPRAATARSFFERFMQVSMVDGERLARLGSVLRR